MEIAGDFGEKRFLVKMEELVRGRPYDFVTVRLDVPTVQGALTCLVECRRAYIRFGSSAVNYSIMIIHSKLHKRIVSSGLTGTIQCEES
jgi:hypothetical protein